MTEKRFVKGHCCGDVGLIDTKKEEWFVENINSISDSERNWNDVLDKLNEVAEENEQLQHKLSQQEMEYATTACRQAEENEELKDRIDNYNTAFKKLQDLTEKKITENEQLKADKQSLIDFIKKEFPKSHKHILEGFND